MSVVESNVCDGQGNQISSTVSGSKRLLDVSATVTPSGTQDVNIISPIGQAAMAASVPVVVASDQSPIPISAASLPLPSGAATLAEQQTQSTSLAIIDDWDESDRAKVNPIVGQAGVQGGSGAVSANTQRVVLATDVALPTGANTIGSIASITTSVTPGTAAANLGKAEDAAHGSGDTGVMLLAVRSSGATTFADANGDYSPVAVTANGSLFIGSIVPGTTATELGKAEDAAHTSGDTGVMALGVANESNTARAANNDYVPLATDTEGNIRIVGNRDNGEVDAGEPVKIGGKATTGTSEPSAVDNADRVDAFFDLKGYLMNKPFIQRSAISTIMNAQVLDDSPTSANSSAIDTGRDAWIVIFLTLDATLTPTRIQFIPQSSDDNGTTWYDYDQEWYQEWFFEDTEVVSSVTKSYLIPAYGDDVRIRVVATGTDATNFFTITIKAQTQNIR